VEGAIGTLIETLDVGVEALDGPVLVYGAGNKGREVAAFLLGRGYQVLGLADRAARPNEAWQGLPVRTLVDWQGRIPLDETIIVVGIHNHLVAMAPLLDELLSTSGARRVVNPVEFQALFPAEFPSAYWLTTPAAYRRHGPQIAALWALLEDATSRNVLERVLEFRLTGNYGRLPEPDHAGQYCPGDLPRWEDPMRLVDCGAFDGDSLRQFRRHGYTFAQIVAFEPDPVSYRALSRQVAEWGGGIVLPCGLAAETRLAGFDSTGTGSSRMSAESGHVVQCVSIDEALPGLRPTLIKMDIEGAEPDALRGARQTIAAHRPGLAISVYHHPAHLWEIPLLVASWDLGYRFHLRMHGHSSFDLVLYALAS
jgi:FkbM family methyltransferase